MKKSSYIIFGFQGRNILAIPLENKHIRKSAYKFYRGTTIRRKIVRLGIRLLTKLNLEATIGYRTNTPVPRFPDFDFESWLENIERSLNIGKLYAIVSFPSQTQRKRFYVNLVSKQGEPIAFAKVSLDDENDVYLLNESNNIYKLSKGSYSFNIPNILIEDKFQGHRYLVFKSFPLNTAYRNNTWESTLKKYSKELCKDTHDTKFINELSWWDKFIKEVPLKDRETFSKDINIKGDNIVEVCLAHGDLHNGNICYMDDEAWLFDWEASCIDAPIMTDEVVFFLASNQREIVSDPVNIARKLMKEIIGNDDNNTKEKVAMALAFLSTTGRQDAKSMILHWQYVID